MKFEEVKRESSEVTIKVSLTAEEFAKATDYAYNKNKQRFNIPGFRKGKAPKNIVIRHYGEGVLFEDATNWAIQQNYPKALDELKLDPVSKAEFDVEEIDIENGLVFTAVFAVEPSFELGDYKSIKIESYPENVEEALVDAKIQSEREKNGKVSTVARAAKIGDTVNLDFVGYIDEEAFDGGAMKNHDLTLGSGAFIPGFEDQLVGASAGDHVEVKVVFPEDYRTDHLAGKEAVFQCDVNHVSEIVLPELDDEFAKDVSEFDTLEEYKDSVRKELQEEHESKKEEVVRARVLDAVRDLVTVTLPERMVDTEIDQMVENLSRVLSRQGLSIEQYTEYLGGMDELRSGMRSDAENKIKLGLALGRIKEQEKFDITDADVEEQLEKDSKQHGLDVDTLKKIYGEKGLEDLKEQVAYEKAIKMLVEIATK